ncbi:uncharacterized protein LOC135956668 [Calliphora vicina]|uniref:uncharacterized protein LOC135956668 n=1 Tax=Calliphora vicina TaxID=7373 RepID=UPI00325B7B33
MVGGRASFTLSSYLEEQNRNISNSYYTQSFQEQDQVDGFIRSSKLIKIIETVAENFIKNCRSSKSPENIFNAIVIKLPFVYCDFLNHPLDLLHFVIEEPVQFANAVKYCVFALLRDILKDLFNTADINNITNIDIEQVHILIRFVGLPLQQDLCFQPHLNTYPIGLTEVIGILSALTEPEKVV